MKEFMTKVSDYFSERRNDPEKNGNPLVFCMLGVVILIIIILCILLLWQKSTSREEEEMTSETFEKKPEIMMSEPGEGEEEALKQEYLANIEYLGEKVESLLQFMSEVKETLEETTLTNEEENILLKQQLDEIMGDIGSLLTRLQNTQNYLYDLTDMIHIMNTETIPVIQEQISEIESQMSQVNSDIADIYAKIGALETTDAGLQAKIKEIEGSLKTSVEQNITDITNKFESMNTQIKQVEMQIGNVETRINNLETQITDLRSQIQQFTSQSLKYRYDKTTNTLYLSGNP